MILIIIFIIDNIYKKEGTQTRTSVSSMDGSHWQINIWMGWNYQRIDIDREDDDIHIL